MRRTILLGALFAGLLAPFAMAHAHGGVSVSVSTPDFGFRIGGPIYRPAPVVVAPVYAPPVYAPPVYAPAPVYVAPRVVYAQPVVVPRYYHVPRPVVVAPRYAGAWVAPYRHEYRHWKHRHGHHGHDDDRNDRHRGHRAGYGF